MRLDEILAAAGKHKPRKRVGRGPGSGHGKTSCRGHKGLGQRAGGTVRIDYEGGQNPAIRRLPKRGFNNKIFSTTYQLVNVAELERFNNGDRVDPAGLAAAGLIRDGDRLVKVLGDGVLTKKLAVVADAFSASAGKKIADIGGSVERR